MNSRALTIVKLATALEHIRRPTPDSSVPLFTASGSFYGYFKQAGDAEPDGSMSPGTEAQVLGADQRAIQGDNRGLLAAILRRAQGGEKTAALPVLPAGLLRATGATPSRYNQTPARMARSEAHHGHRRSPAPASDPITEEDLYRKYKRLPSSTVARVREKGQNATLPNRIRGMFASSTAGRNAVEEYERGVRDRITAQNRAKTTGKLQATGGNKGRGGFAGLLRGAADKYYNVVKAVGTQPRRKAKAWGWTPKLNTQRGYPGAAQDAALSQEIKEKFGEPLSRRVDR